MLTLCLWKAYLLFHISQRNTENITENITENTDNITENTENITENTQKMKSNIVIFSVYLIDI